MSLESLRGTDPTIDGGTDADAGARPPDASIDGPYCSRHQAPTFCFDFDDKPLGTDYGLITTDASVALDDAEAKSLPFSLKCSRPPSTVPNVYPESGISRKVATLAKSFDLDFDVRVEPPWDDKNPVRMLGVYFDTADGGANGEISFYAHETRLDVQEETKPQVLHYATRYPLNAVWTHVHLFVDLPGKHVRVEIDGAVALDEALSKAYPPSFLEFDLGGLGVNGPPYIAQTIRFDNVVGYVR